MVIAIALRVDILRAWCWAWMMSLVGVVRRWGRKGPKDLGSSACCYPPKGALLGWPKENDILKIAQDEFSLVVFVVDLSTRLTKHSIRSWSVKWSSLRTLDQVREHVQWHLIRRSFRTNPAWKRKYLRLALFAVQRRSCNGREHPQILHPCPDHSGLVGSNCKSPVTSEGLGSHKVSAQGAETGGCLKSNCKRSFTFRNSDSCVSLVFSNALSRKAPEGDWTVYKLVISMHKEFRPKSGSSQHRSWYGIGHSYPSAPSGRPLRLRNSMMWLQSPDHCFGPWNKKAQYPCSTQAIQWNSLGEVALEILISFALSRR